MIDRALILGMAGMLVSIAGCAPGGSREISGIPAEPELGRSRAAAAHGPVPLVVAPPRAFRTTALAARPAEPRRVAPPDAAPLARTRAGSTADVAEIRDAFAGYRRAFNRRDAAALAAHWSEAGRSVDLVSGEVTAGREAVGAVFASLFATDEDAAIDIDVRSIRPVSADVAVVDGESRIAFGDGAASASRFSAVVVRNDGRWLLESVSESSLPAAAAARKPLADLAWLTGSWEDVGEGLTASIRCFWSAGDAFLIRAHTVTADDAPPARPQPGDDRIPGLLPAAAGGSRELTEIIGWDPERQVIRSWLFTSDGRFAESTWTREGDAWRVRTEGRGADEGRSAECTLVRLGSDEVSVRPGGAGLAGLLPPASDFIRTAR